MVERGVCEDAVIVLGARLEADRLVYDTGQTKALVRYPTFSRSVFVKDEVQDQTNLGDHFHGSRCLDRRIRGFGDRVRESRIPEAPDQLISQFVMGCHAPLSVVEDGEPARALPVASFGGQGCGPRLDAFLGNPAISQMALVAAYEMEMLLVEKNKWSQTSIPK